MSRERVDKLGKLTMLKVIVTCARHVIFYDYFGVHVALYTVIITGRSLRWCIVINVVNGMQSSYIIDKLATKIKV